MNKRIQKKKLKLRLLLASALIEEINTHGDRECARLGLDPKVLHETALDWTPVESQMAAFYQNALKIKQLRARLRSYGVKP